MEGKVRNTVSVKQLAELYPRQFPETRTRDLIYHSVARLSARGEEIAPNGFAPCIIRNAGRVEIDLDALALWQEAGRQAPLAELERRAAA